MITLVRSELYRMATIRASWLTLILFAVLTVAFGALDAYWWALFAGVGAFSISVLTVAQHYQHRTAALIYLARPKRVRVLLAQVIAAVVVSWGITVLGGIAVQIKGGNPHTFEHTLTVVPIMAVFGAATAAVVRGSSWLLLGFAFWFVLVEGLAGQLKWPLPISSYLQAAQGDAFGLQVFTVWAVIALAVAVPTLGRDLTGD